jgi:hypothetical protein
VTRWAGGDLKLNQKTAERVVAVTRSILDGLVPIQSSD